MVGCSHLTSRIGWKGFSAQHLARIHDVARIQCPLQSCERGHAAAAFAFEVVEFSSFDSVLACARPSSCMGTPYHASIEFSDAGLFVLVRRIDQYTEVKVSIAHMAANRRDQGKVCHILLRFRDYLG